MTEVWWCEIHQSRRSQPAFESCQFAVIYPAAASHCRFVDALVIVRDAEGNWPQWMRDRAEDFDQYVVWDWMDALVEAVNENPMPPITDEQAFDHRG